MECDRDITSRTKSGGNFHQGAEKLGRKVSAIVDPWADDARLREANPATRVPTLITDEGIPLTESRLIV